MIKPKLSEISTPSKILIYAPLNISFNEIIRKLIKNGKWKKKLNPKFIRIEPN